MPVPPHFPKKLDRGAEENMPSSASIFFVDLVSQKKMRNLYRD